MNEIFSKIDHKFYSNVITHNQTNEYIFLYSITTHFISNNKNYHSYYTSYSVYQTCPWLYLYYID